MNCTASEETDPQFYTWLYLSARLSAGMQNQSCVVEENALSLVNDIISCSHHSSPAHVRGLVVGSVTLTRSHTHLPASTSDTVGQSQQLWWLFLPDVINEPKTILPFCITMLPAVLAPRTGCGLICIAACKKKQQSRHAAFFSFQLVNCVWLLLSLFSWHSVDIQSNG